MGVEKSKFANDDLLFFNRRQTLERIHFLYGHTDDCFHTQSFLYNRFDQMLESQMIRLGYDIIAFYSINNGLYTLSDHSCDCFSTFHRQRFENKKQTHSTAEAPMETQPREDVPVSGSDDEELNNLVKAVKIVEGSDASFAKERPLSAELPTSGKQHCWRPDVSELINLFDALMRCTEYRVCLIMMDGWQLFTPEFFGDTETDEAGRMSYCMRSWYSLDVSNHNVLLMVFGSMQLDGISNHVSNTSMGRALLSKIINGNDFTDEVHYIGSPKMDEICNTLYHLLPVYRHMYNPAERKMLETAALSFVLDNGGKLKTLVQLLVLDTEHASDILRKYVESEEDELETLKNKEGWESAYETLTRIVSVAGTRKNEDAVLDLTGTTLRFAKYTKHTQTSISLGIVLKGSPGTGKTTIARLIGRILRKYGILEGGNVIEAARDTLVGGYVGQTAMKTRDVINKSLGNVLFIDEAYSLSRASEHASRNDFGIEAIDTIVQAMTKHIGEICIVLAGYPDEMDQMLGSNPGLRSRFNHVITIEDYDARLLRSIFLQTVKKSILPNQQSFVLDDRLLCKSDKQQSLLEAYFENWYAARDRRTFGNARAAENLAEEVMRVCAERFQRSPADVYTIQAEDFPLKDKLFQVRRPSLTAVLETFSDIVGIPEIVSKMMNTALIMEQALIRKNLLAQAGNKRNTDKNPDVIVPGHYLFVGAPGTGKTTIAMKLANVFSALKLVGKYEPVRVTGSMLIQQLQTNGLEKIRQIIQDAVGNVLVIDEAHQLQNYPIICQLLLDPMIEHREDFCIILCCYPHQMDEVLNMDKGLKSRISDIYHFKNYNAEELFSIFSLKLKRTVFHLDDEEYARQTMIAYFDALLKKCEATGEASENGRFTEKALQHLLDCNALRLKEQHVEVSANAALEKKDMAEITLLTTQYTTISNEDIEKMISNDNILLGKQQ